MGHSLIFVLGASIALQNYASDAFRTEAKVLEHPSLYEDFLIQTDVYKETTTTKLPYTTAIKPTNDDGAIFPLAPDSSSITKATTKTHVIPTTTKVTTTKVTTPKSIVPTTTKVTTTKSVVPTTIKVTTIKSVVPTTTKVTTIKSVVPTTTKVTTTKSVVPTTTKVTTTKSVVPTTMKVTTTKSVVPTTTKVTTTKSVVPTTTITIVPTTTKSIKTTTASAELLAPKNARYSIFLLEKYQMVYEIAAEWDEVKGAKAYEICYDTKQDQILYPVATTWCVVVPTNSYSTGDSVQSDISKVTYSNVRVRSYNPDKPSLSSHFTLASPVDNSKIAYKSFCTVENLGNDGVFIETKVTFEGFAVAQEVVPIKFTATWDRPQKAVLGDSKYIEVCFYAHLQVFSTTEHSCVVVKSSVTSASAFVNVKEDLLYVNALVRPVSTCYFNSLITAQGNRSLLLPQAYPRELYSEMKYRNASAPNRFSCVGFEKDSEDMSYTSCVNDNAVRIIYQPSWQFCPSSSVGFVLKDALSGNCITTGLKGKSATFQKCEPSNKEQLWLAKDCQRSTETNFLGYDLRNVGTDLCMTFGDVNGFVMKECAEFNWSEKFHLTLTPHLHSERDIRQLNHRRGGNSASKMNIRRF